MIQITLLFFLRKQNQATQAATRQKPFRPARLHCLFRFYVCRAFY